MVKHGTSASEKKSSKAEDLLKVSIVPVYVDAKLLIENPFQRWGRLAQLNFVIMELPANIRPCVVTNTQRMT